MPLCKKWSVVKFDEDHEYIVLLYPGKGIKSPTNETGTVNLVAFSIDPTLLTLNLSQ
jgi:hypothetical protein